MTQPVGGPRRRRATDVVALVVAITLALSAASCVHHPGLPATGTSGYRAKASLTAEGAISAVSTVRLVLDAAARDRTTERYLDSAVGDQEDRLEAVVSSFSAVAPPTAAARSLRADVIDALDSAVEHVARVRIALDAGDRAAALAARRRLAHDATRLGRFQ